MKTRTRRTNRWSAIAAVVVVVAVTGLVSGCPDGSLLDVVQPRVVDIDFASGGSLAETTALTIVFSRGMDPESLELGGELGQRAAEEWSPGVALDGTQAQNINLTIRPSTTWPPGSNKRLTVACADPRGVFIDELHLAYGVLSGVVYVHAAEGLDTNPGTSDQPKKTIAAAVTTAEQHYETAEVHVAAGTYLVTGTTGVTRNISLYGGYAASDWAVRDPDEHEAIWRNDSVSGDTSTVSYGDTTTAATIAGFTITTGSGSSSTAISVSGGTVVISNNIIETGTPQHAAGVAVQGANVQIRENLFRTSDVEGVVTCIVAADSTVTIADNRFDGAMIRDYYGIVLIECDEALVERNHINAGQPLSFAVAIHANGGSLTVRNNVITAGNMHTDDASGQYGVYLNRSSATLHNNTIDGGTGSSPDGIMTTAVMLHNQVNAVIENNVIFTRGGDLRTGIRQNDTASFPVAFNNNVMFDCPDANYYYAPDGTDYVTSVALLETFLADNGVAVSGNAFEDSGALSSPPAFRPTADSPASIRSGGRDLSAHFTDDIDGNQRSGWSAGAYEY